MAPAPPFPVLVIGYVFNGFGISLQVNGGYVQFMINVSPTLAMQDAGANGYVASLKDNANVKMGILHAIYGKYTPFEYTTQRLKLRQRSRCIYCSFVGHAVQKPSPMVFPLPNLAGYRGPKRDIPSYCFP